MAVYLIYRRRNTFSVRYLHENGHSHYSFKTYDSLGTLELGQVLTNTIYDGLNVLSIQIIHSSIGDSFLLCTHFPQRMNYTKRHVI